MDKCLLVFLVFGAFSKVHSNDNLLVDDLRTEFIKIEDELWEFVLNGRGDNSVDPGLYLVKTLHAFDFAKMTQMPDDPLLGMQVVRKTEPFLHLYSDLRIIRNKYDKFRTYLAQNLIPSKTDYAEHRPSIQTDAIVDDIMHDVNYTVINIFDRMFGKNESNMIWEIFEIISNSDYFCKGYDQSPQQVFYNLYKAVALANLKGYIMIQFSYLALRLEHRGNNTAASLLARETYRVRANNTMAAIRGTMEIANGRIMRCDPKLHIEGTTYERLTRLIQGHIENEVDLNRDGTCTKTCGTYWSTSNYGCYDKNNGYCRNRKPCAGRILGCSFVQSHFKACISPYESYRRYEYIEYKSGRTLGHKTNCNSHDVYSWNRWFVHCSYCLCLCDEQGVMSDRYINLRPVMADVANNRVVTGLRIIKHNRIIHLQIQEGKLLPYGYIDNSTIQWVPVENYRITDFNYKNGKDYHTMTFEKRSMLLDKLYTHESNHLITGVRFDYVGGKVRFQINARPFDFKTGQLSNDSYYAYGADSRSKLNIVSPDIPTHSYMSEPDHEPGKYVEFTHTDFDKDAAQTTIPFFDRQPAISSPAVPLKGAGIYYKGEKGYGGFVAPMVVTYDFSEHMDISFPEAGERKDDLEEFDVPLN